MSRAKNPLDTLQSMVNGILIETGKALRGSDKDGGRTLSNANTRLRSTIPSAIENFHHALDEFEYEIVRAKAVLLRDYEELRSKRIALENPPIPIVESVREPSVEAELSTGNEKIGSNHPTPQSFIKDERLDVADAALTPQDLVKGDVKKKADSLSNMQAPSPPSSNDMNIKPESSGLDTDTMNAMVNDSATLEAEGIQDSSIDSLFEGLDSGKDINFSGIDFLGGSTMQDNSQTQNSDFDLTSFDNNLQDFNMAEAQNSNETLNNNNSATDTQDDLFGVIDTSGGNDLMDIDGSLPLADENTFDDLFLFDDDGVTGGETHGIDSDRFDDNFFGI